MDILLAVARFAHLASVVAAAGLAAFAALVLPPVRRAHPDRVAALDDLDGRLRRLAILAVAAALASALGWLVVQAIAVTGTPAGALDLLARTSFGRVWQVRLAVLVALGAVLGLARSRWLLAAALAAAAAASLAPAGHAAATEGWLGLVHLAGDAVHALAAAIWLGGLAALVLAAAVAGRRDPALVAPLARRFSAVALAAMAALLVTGVVAAAVLVGDVPGLVGTPYGRLLLLKLALLAPILALAVLNRRRVRGRAPAGRPAPWAGALVRAAGAEVALGAGVLAVVAVLGVTPPARHVDPTWPFSFRFSLEVASGDPSFVPLLVGCALFAGAGVALLVHAGMRGFRPRWAVALAPAVVVYAVAGVLSAVAIDAYPTTYLRPAVTYHAISLAHGGRAYREHCAPCHGPWGRGDGPAGVALPTPPADLTAKHAGDHTAGDLFWWLTHGIAGTAMPGFGDRLDETARWDVINFVRALYAAEEARRLGPSLDAGVRIAPPDFTAGLAGGDSVTLRDLRGSVVHLVVFALPASRARLEQLADVVPALARAGARVVAVGTGLDARSAAALADDLAARGVAVAVEGAEEIVAAYALLSRTPAMGPDAPAPPHVEFLIDRQGWLRARWVPGGEGGWADVEALEREVAALAAEPPSAPPPDDHVH